MKNYGRPFEFWRDVKNLQGKPPLKIKPLKTSYIVEDSEDSDFGEEIIEKVTDPQQQADLISTTWETIYHPHKGNQFENKNTTKIEEWYTDIKDQLHPDTKVNLSNLKEDHPLTRPISTMEVSKAIQFTRHKPQQSIGTKSHHRLSIKIPTSKY